MPKPYIGMWPVGARYIPYDNEEFKTRFLEDHVAEMLAACQSMLEFDDLPDTIPEREIKRLLQQNGYAILPYDQPYAFFATPGGEPDAYYLPTTVVVANPGLNYDATLKVHDECAVVRHDSFYHGLLPILNRYGSLLADAYQTLYIACINARVPALFSAEDERTRKAVDDYFCDLKKGKLGAVYENAFLEGLRSTPYASAAHSEITDIIELIQYLRACEWNDLGLNANYNMKREAINSVEAQLNDDALLPTPADIVKSIQEGLDEYNAHTGRNIRVRLGSAWQDRSEMQEEQTNGEEGDADEEASTPEADGI